MELRFDWIVPVNQPLLWICQTSRSGGTLLMRLLDGHPQVHTHPYKVSFNNLSDMRLDMFHLTGFQKRSSNMEQDNYPMYFDAQWFKYIYDMQSDKITERHLYDAFWTATFNAWRNYQNLYGEKEWVVGHTALVEPKGYKDVVFFREVYPDGKMLFMTRDPYDWLSSAVHLTESTPYNGYYPDVMKDYRLNLERVLKLYRESKDSIIILRFEELLQRPNLILGELAEILGIQNTPSLLSPTFNGSPWYPNSSHEHERVAAISKEMIGAGDALKDTYRIDDEIIELYREVVKCKTL